MASDWGMSWTAIAQGVVIGITVSIVLALVDIGKAHRKRQKQVRYLSNVIVRQRQKIDSVGGDESPPEVRIAEKEYPERGDRIRQLFCRGLHNDLFLIIDGKDSVITDEERVQIAKLFEPFRALEEKEGTLNQDYYKYLFEELEKIPWLKIKPPP